MADNAEPIIDEEHMRYLEKISVSAFYIKDASERAINSVSHREFGQYLEVMREHLGSLDDSLFSMEIIYVGQLEERVEKRMEDKE